MSDFFSDRTVVGLGTTLLGVGFALWRRFAPARPLGGSAWYVKLAQLGSATLKQQAAEGALDTYRESLLLEREERLQWQTRYREASTEIDRLRAEITALRDQPVPPTTSATSDSSDPSSAGSSGSVKGRTRRRSTT